MVVSGYEVMIPMGSKICCDGKNVVKVHFSLLENGSEFGETCLTDFCRG